MNIQDFGMNNVIEYSGESYNDCSITVNGNHNRVIIKTHQMVNCHFNINGDYHEVVISENANLSKIQVQIKSSDSVPTTHSKLLIHENTVVQSAPFFLQGDNTIVEIGKGTTVLGCTFFAIECDSSIIIGEDCMLSWGIEIRTSDWHSIYDMDTDERINQQKLVHIHDRVWIGSHAIILKGVTVDSDSIIGTHSIVTKSVPSNVVVAGNPAKVIRENVKWDKRNNEHK
jgi:carbonic anhydrase/acetyltransferase-like protein (isoleucine patch superfamily)